MKMTRTILREGYDGKMCFVHARLAAHEDHLLVTAQLMDVAGSDCFFTLQSSCSTDGIRRAKEAMTSVEAVLEEFEWVGLTASKRASRHEVEIVNMNVAVVMSVSEFWFK